jgi:hypothetical protein
MLGKSAADSSMLPLAQAPMRFCLRVASGIR